LFQRKKRDIVKKEQPNIYKTLLDKKRNTYLNLARENITWFQKKMEKDYGKNRARNTFFLYRGNDISILESPTNDPEIVEELNDIQHTVTVVPYDKEYNMRYGPLVLYCTFTSLYGITTIFFSVGLLYYLMR